MNTASPKRLIEVDLPIKRISEHSRREKSIRHGHISTLHIWWARRPLAACRAVICAALWPDPADPHCPESFREVARLQMQKWAKDNTKLSSAASSERFLEVRAHPEKLQDAGRLRTALLDFVADFANWDNSIASEYLATARSLTRAAHEALGGHPGTRPLAVDPFTGGGSIPLEALRLGADAFASDLNPVAVTLEKLLLEYIPKYRGDLSTAVRRWGQWIVEEANKRIGHYYPADSKGKKPDVYLLARTVRCEGPNCGAVLPLVRSTELDGQSGLGFQIGAHRKSVILEVSFSTKASGPTVRSGSAVCPISECGYVTPAAKVRAQLSAKHGGAADARLMFLVFGAESGREFRAPGSADFDVLKKLAAKPGESFGRVNPIRPAPNTRGVSAITTIGMNDFADIYTPRQRLSLECFATLISELWAIRKQHFSDDSFALATCISLACVVGRVADYNSSLCTWVADGGFVGHTFTKQALPNVWDFVEVNPLSGSTGSFQSALQWVVRVIDANAIDSGATATVVRGDAQQMMLPDDSADLVFTDPPYYAEIPYGDISDYFYIWMKRSLGAALPDLFADDLVDKTRELIVTKACEGVNKDAGFFEHGLNVVSDNLRHECKHSGILVIVFANAKTAAWEAILEAIVAAGLQIVASWPIDTERPSRTRAQKAASLQSSVHLVCRPRKNADGSFRSDGPGEWRDVLAELPKRIHEWMPRLADEGIVGADAIFACLGPALEVFSRYSSVEKANGEKVFLKEYLVHVWAAVAKEALAMVFKGADATGFEEDARLTAMWLWTLFAGQERNGSPAAADDGEEPEGEAGSKPSKGYTLEYDAARKIAQGLGAHLESLNSLVEIDGDVARLIPVADRTRRLFHGDDGESTVTKAKRKAPQMDLSFVAELKQAEEAEGWGSKGVPSAGATVLDRVHQTMILFAAGRTEALRRFLVDEAVGRDERFWRLAQVLSYLYPSGGDERRWIEGVLARKKGLGF